MAELPPSLGDGSKSKMRLTHEEVALPGTRKEIVSKFESILSQGGVQKVIVEVGRPIKVSKFTKDEAAPPKEMIEEELFARARNAQIDEFDSTGLDSFHEYIFRALGLLTQKRLKARAFLVSNANLLRTNLDVDKFWDLSQLCGIEVVEVAEIPRDVLLLTASEPGEEDIKCSLRMLMSEKEKR